METGSEMSGGAEVPLDPQAAAVLAQLGAAGGPPLEALTPAEARAAMTQLQAALWPPVPSVQIEDLAPRPGLPVGIRIYRPHGVGEDEQLPGLIYFHGGGWVLGTLDGYDALCGTLAQKGRLAVVSVDYRLAPEHQFPAAFDDASGAAAWIAANASSLGLDADRLALGGDSAGGALAASTAIHFAANKGPSIKAQLLIYPVTDLGEERASHSQVGEGYILTTAAMRWFRDLYLGTEGSATDWRASPLRAPGHAGLPPAVILTCGFDPLRDEGFAYVRTLIEAGVAVEHRHAADQMHGFMQWGVLDAADDELGVCASALASFLKG